ncbi:MAG: pitrilysin family protein [Candidatus Pacearchaeota archaeon]
MKSKIFNFYREKLKNGITILFEKRSTPVISTAAAIRTGAINENEKNKGIAHFVEHMLFKGTKKKNYEVISREIEKKGGILNGYTDEERTVFWNKLPSKYLITSLENPIQIISNPAFKEKEFEKEKGVIIEEIKMYKDNPIFYSMDKIKELLYGKPFGLSIIGNIPNIQNIKRQELIKFYKNHYSANNIILSIVGKAEFYDIKEQLEKIFVKKNIREIIKTKKIKIECINKKQKEKRKGLEQTHLVFGFHTPLLNDIRRYAYELALTHLTEGMSSVLFNKIREKRGIAYSVKGGINIGKNYSYATIYVGTRKEKIEEVNKIVIRELKNLKNFKQKDLEETREQLIGSRRLLEEDSTEVMNRLLIEEEGFGAEEFYNYESRLQNLKLQDIRNIKIKKLSIFTLLPE